MIRVGVIGCGAISQIMHIPYLVDYEHFELVAIADSYAPILEAVGNRYHIPHRYTEWQELLKRDDIEAVIVAHSGSHRETIIAAVEAGKDVFTEKPLTWNYREAQEVATHLARYDRIVQLGYHKRYDPAYPYLQEHIKKMQDIGFVRVTVLHPPNEMGLSPFRLRRGNGIFEDGHKDSPPWEVHVQGGLQGLTGGDVAPLVDEALGEQRKNDYRLRLGYGMVTVSLIHQIYVLHGLLGEPKRVVSTHIWRDGLSIHTILEYPNGTHCTIDWHFLSHIKDYREEYAFFGNYDRVIWQLPSPYLKNAPSPVILQGGDGELAWEKRVVVSYDEAFRNELLAFYENVKNRTQPATNIQEAVLHMKLIQEIIDAAQ